MNTRSRFDCCRRVFALPPRRLLAPLCASLLALNAPAQSVFIPAPQPPAGLDQPAPPPGPQSLSTNLMNTAGVVTPPSGNSIPTKPLQWGQVVAHPRLGYGLTYGDGILSTPGNRRKTLIQEIAGGLGLDLGRVWRLDYAPTAMIYSDRHFRNTVNHIAGLTGSTSYKEWTLGLAQRCSLTSDPIRETGAQTDQKNYTTALNATCQFSHDLSLDLGVAQNLQFVSGSSGNTQLQDSREWSTLDWLNYHLGPNLGFALGAGAGFVAVDRSGSVTNSDMTYEQALGRITFQVSRKINFSVNGGAEFRQFLDSTEPALVNPIFGVTLAYRPFDYTTITVNALRNVAVSYLQSQVVENTSVNAGISQRFLGHVFLNLGGGYGVSSYRPSNATITTRREDRNAFFRASLDFTFLKHGTASVFYAHSKNSSSDSSLDYDSDQMGLRIGFGF